MKNLTAEKKKRSWAYYLWLIPLIVGTIYILRRENMPASYQQIDGMIFGTIYRVTYQGKENLKFEIDTELKRVDNSLSPFNKTSVISQVNRNEEVVTDSLFQNVFRCSMAVSDATNGAFDITIASLANAWGFGFKGGAFPDKAAVDSLLELTGYKKVILQDGRVIKDDPRIMLSCSAVAKGYAVDVIGWLLEKKGITNYMIDIGGELVLRGKNPKGTDWRIGINQPVDDSLSVNQNTQLVLQLTGKGVATSGNYRNFYYKDGKKYAHTIDPRTGYPVLHSLLSATVVATDCMSADAYATAFMVMGLEETIAYVQEHPEIGVCLIYSGEEGEFLTYVSDNVKPLIAQ